MAFCARWNWQRCQTAPGRTARRAAFSPAWSSLTTKRTPRAAADQAVEEGAPVDFGFRGIAGDAEHAPSPVRPDADGGEQGGIADHAALAQLLVAGVEQEIVDLARGRRRQAASSSSRSAAARLTWVDDRLFRPNSAITLATSRVETPCTYISAIASITAREDRRPRSSDCG